MSKRASEIAIKALADGSIRTLAELRKLGCSPQTLRRMLEAGRIASPGYGLYQSIDATFDPREQYAALRRLVPSAMVWLDSAAAIHGISQDLPEKITIAVPERHRGSVSVTSSFGNLEVDATRLSRERDFDIGVETMIVHGVSIPVTGPARTVVDMWRYSPLNTSMQSQFQKVDEEAFLDVITNYLSPSRGNGSGDELTTIARELGVLEGFNPHIKAISHVSSMLP